MQKYDMKRVRERERETGRRNDNKLTRFRYGIIMNFYGDAASSTREPPKCVHVPA